MVIWQIIEMLVGRLVTPVAPSQATAVAMNTLTDAIKYCNEPFRDVLIVKVFAVYRKWAYRKSICFAFPL